MNTDKIVDYHICNESDAWELGVAVRDLLNYGWTLYGSPYVSKEGPHCQAMVKYEVRSKVG